MLRNMATSLLRHETIRTTVPKAKELRRVVEPLITLAKVDSLGKRRLAYSRLRDEGVVEKLFVDLGAALQGAGRRLHAYSQDGTAPRRFGRYGIDAAGRRGRGAPKRPKTEGRQSAQGPEEVKKQAEAARAAAAKAPQGQGAKEGCRPPSKSQRTTR